MHCRYRSQHEAEKDAALKQFDAFKKAAAAKQNKMKEEFDDKLQSMMEQSKAALKDFQDKTKSFADVIARLENQVTRSTSASLLCSRVARGRPAWTRSSAPTKQKFRSLFALLMQSIAIAFVIG
jgi:hypothetical protein